MLNAFGYKATMISLGVGFALLGAVALVPIKRRIPLPSRTNEDPDRDPEGRRGRDYSYLKKKTMIAGSLIILMTGLGNFIPPLWLPCGYRVVPKP